MKSIHIFIIASACCLSGMRNSFAQTGSFTKISIPDHARVILTQGSEISVKFEADGGTANAEMNNDELIIHSKEFVTAYVTVVDLKKIEISGNGNVVADSTLKLNDLKIVISGIGKVILPLEAHRLETNISGKGKITLSGKVAEVDADISGAGNIDASALEVSRLEANISGAGKIEADVKDELDVNISGAGSVSYVNPPAKISKNISGIGKVGTVQTGDEKDGGDTTTVNLGDKKIIIIGDDDNDLPIEIETDHESGTATVRYNKGDKTQAHWAGFEMGFNNYFTSGFDTQLPEGYEFLELNNGKSIAVNLNVFDWKAKILDHNIMFVTGLGVSWNNWRFQNDISLTPNTPLLTGTFDSIDYKKSKLTASYLTLPLLVEFNSNGYEKKTFHLSAGIILGYRLASHTKVVYKENDKTRKVKTFDDFNLESFRYDATVRIGFRGYTFFASYGLNNLFKKSASPELHPFTFGLTLINW